MQVTRRDFLRYCGLSAAALGLSASELGRLAHALTAPGAPTVVWFHGSGCQGDSISLLNRIAASGPGTSVDDVLVNAINLQYHAVLMTLAGESAAAAAMKARREGSYILVLEGGIPTKFDGGACNIWTWNGKEVTYLDAVLDFAQGTSIILAAGTCAAFGGIPKAPPNPTGIMGVKELLDSKGLTGKTIVNIAGCPANPDWMAGTIVRLLLGQPLPLDAFNRPTEFYGKNVHENCPRNASAPTHIGYATEFGQDLMCLQDLGCRGPFAMADCPSRKWNNGVNWCVDSNGMCIGCVEPEFPGGPLYQYGSLTTG